jgi:hypothetical protein
LSHAESEVRRIAGEFRRHRRGGGERHGARHGPRGGSRSHGRGGSNTGRRRRGR